MKLASLKSGRDGKLIVVSRDLTRYAPATEISPTLQYALDHWQEKSGELRAFSEKLETGDIPSEPFDPAACDAPLPRSYHWADGSAYVTHVELVRKTRNATVPDNYWTDPLMYMGASDAFLGPNDDIPLENDKWGLDYEAEIAIITDDVPQGTKKHNAGDHVKLIGFINDITLRNLVPDEIVKQFGFYHAKPHTAFSPVFVTPDELGDYWDGCKLNLPIHSNLNGKKLGSPHAGKDMTFNFCELIAHAAKTRALVAGTVIGSGTVATKGSHDGVSCLSELRCLEILRDGSPTTPFMTFGDQIEIEMFDAEGKTIFGQINQKVVKYEAPR